MDRSELELWLEGSDDVARMETWIRDNSGCYEDIVDMVGVFLNSDPDGIDFSKEFVCFYEDREQRFPGASCALFSLEADDVVALIESGDLE